MIPVTIALPKTIKPMATTPAMSTISIWIAMVYPARSAAFLKAYGNGERVAIVATSAITIKLGHYPGQGQRPPTAAETDARNRRFAPTLRWSEWDSNR